MSNPLSKLLIDSLTSTTANNIGFSTSKSFCSIFMLHRFAVDDEGIHGHSANLLRQCLEYLRKQKFNFVSAEDLADMLIEGRPIPKRSVCFTLDDGFWDQASVSAPIFADYDCPATYYLVTRFLDNEYWMWDSKLEFLFESCTLKELAQLATQWSVDSTQTNFKHILFRKLIDELKKHNEAGINASLEAWANQLEVVIPDQAPRKYAAMSWQDAQSIISMGLKVGPHSVTHPILANETAADSERQINQSWDELKIKIPEASNVFCYPVGRYGKDFGDREMEIVARSEMKCAHAADPGFVEPGKQDALFGLKRYGFPEDLTNFKQYATWLERAKDIIRSK